MMERVLVTGISGLLAPFIAHEAARLGTVHTTARKKGDYSCELTEESAVKSLMKDVDPTIVIHAAGLTNVDTCEKEPQKAEQGNFLTARNLARSLSTSSLLVYISTDQVYPDSRGPHMEGSEAPVNVYGASKLAGERVVLEHPNSLVLRTNLFGRSQTPGRKSLSDWIHDSLKENESITLFEDVLFSPLNMTTLATLIMECVEKKLCGVFNLGCREGMTKDAFGRAVAAHFGLQTETARTGRSTEFTGRAQRAADLRLDVSKIEKALGYPMPTLLQEIAKL